MSLVDSGEVVAVARIAVAELAPEEMVAFDRIAAEWTRRGVARRGVSRRRARAAVGFGVDAALITEIVLTIVSAALPELASGRPLWWWRRRSASPRRRGQHRRTRHGTRRPADADRLRTVVDRYVADIVPETDPARRAVVRDAIVGAYLLPPTGR